MGVSLAWEHPSHKEHTSHESVPHTRTIPRTGVSLAQGASLARECPSHGNISHRSVPLMRVSLAQEHHSHESVPHTRSIPHTRVSLTWEHLSHRSIPRTRTSLTRERPLHPRTGASLTRGVSLTRGACPCCSTPQTCSAPQLRVPAPVEGLSCTSQDARGWSRASNQGQDLSGQTLTPPLCPPVNVSAPVGCRGSLCCLGRAQAPLGAAFPSAPAPK